jgi:hypothetical protein
VGEGEGEGEAVGEAEGEGVGVEPRFPPPVVLPLPLPLPVVLPLPLPLLVVVLVPPTAVTESASVPEPDMVGTTKTAEPPDPAWATVSRPTPEPDDPRRPHPPATGDDGEPATGSALAGTEGAGNEGGSSWSVAGGGCSTRIEIVESSRKAIAPADATMTGTVLPAGWERKTAPAWPTLVLIRPVNSARAS